MVTKQALLEFFTQPRVKQWHDGVTLKPSTLQKYSEKLCVYLGSEPASTFLERAEKDSKQVSIEIKGRIAEIFRQTPRQAHQTKYALKSFLEFYETDVRVNGRLPVKRTRKKVSLTIPDAQRIIIETDEPYRGVFTMMLWGGLGEDELMEVMSSAAILSSIESQRGNGKSYIRIDLAPRKSTLDEFFTLVPKQHVPKLPALTKRMKGRGGVMIDPHDMQVVWRRAAKKAKIWQEGLGPHTLRSVFKSQCDAAGVSPSASEFCLGHGAGDRYGYSRPNEETIVTELKKLWEKQGLDLREKAAKVDELERKLDRVYDLLYKRAHTSDQFPADAAKLEQELEMEHPKLRWEAEDMDRQAREYEEQEAKELEIKQAAASDQRPVKKKVKSAGKP
jgi:hypothetical protein